MADLLTSFAGVFFKNPVVAASGTYGFGEDYSDLYAPDILGGISCKGTTLYARDGNPPPRITETPSGMLNSVGLQNPGTDHFIDTDLQKLRKHDVVVIANVAGSSADDYCAAAGKISEAGADIIELNISCPNVKCGGMAFGTDPNTVTEITKRVKNVCDVPVMVKLSPNVTSIADIAKAAEQGGADALSLINTITGMQIDIYSRRPVLKNNTGGLSGPAVTPVAVRMVHEVYEAVDIPIMGMGGITVWQDAVEMMLAGASAVQVGAANFIDPYACPKIIAGLDRFLDENNIKRASDIVGKAEMW